MKNLFFVGAKWKFYFLLARNRIFILLQQKIEFSFRANKK